MGKTFQYKHVSQIQFIWYVKPLTYDSLNVPQFHWKNADLTTHNTNLFSIKTDNVSTARKKLTTQNSVDNKNLYWKHNYNPF